MRKIDRIAYPAFKQILIDRSICGAELEENEDIRPECGSSVEELAYDTEDDVGD